MDSWKNARDIHVAKIDALAHLYLSNMSLDAPIRVVQKGPKL